MINTILAVADDSIVVLGQFYNVPGESYAQHFI
jgi:hypothetical protein